MYLPSACTHSYYAILSGAGSFAKYSAVRWDVWRPSYGTYIRVVSRGGGTDLRPGTHLYGGTGYVTECIGKINLRTFTVTYEKCSSSDGCVESSITYRSLK